jgi:hypothetical protein
MTSCFNHPGWPPPACLHHHRRRSNSAAAHVPFQPSVHNLLSSWKEPADPPPPSCIFLPVGNLPSRRNRTGATPCGRPRWTSKVRFVSLPYRMFCSSSVPCRVGFLLCLCWDEAEATLAVCCTKFDICNDAGSGRESHGIPMQEKPKKYLTIFALHHR